MDDDAEFVDYYALLRITPECDQRMVEKAYRHFAQMYHPDHPETADVSKFQQVIEGYAILRDPEQRARYNQKHRGSFKPAFFASPKSSNFQIDQDTALIDAEAHEKILYFLYKRRREHADEPGVIGYYIQQMLNCSDESFDFHLWYLKSKGLVTMTEKSELEITIEGVDHVIAHSKTSEAAKLIASPKPAQAANGDATA